MKNLLLIALFFSVSIVSFAGDISDQNDPYVEAASKMCECVNESMSVLSDRMVGIIVDSKGDGAFLETEFEKYFEEDFESANADIELFQGTMLAEMGSCFDRVANEYEDAYSDESDDAIEAKIMAAMERMEGCEATLVFLQLGENMSDDEEEPINEEFPEPSMDEEMDPFLFMADDLCICLNEATIPMSERMVWILEESKGIPSEVKKMMKAYQSEDEAAANEDAELMESIGSEIQYCLGRMESEYESLFEMESEESIQEKTMYHLETIEGCQVAYGVMNLYFTLEE